jgi:hypothetical protein
LRIAAPSMPRLAVATDQVVHGVGNLCKREGDCFQPLGLVLGVDLPDHLSDEADNLGERTFDVGGPLGCVAFQPL